MVGINGRIQRSSIGAIYFQPKTVSIAQNNTFVVSVYLTAPRPITVAEVHLSYDSAKLEFVSMDSSASSLDSTIQQNGSNGQITISRAKLNPVGVIGVVLLSSITFRALVANTTATVSIASGNAAINGRYNNPSLSSPFTVAFN